MTVRNDLTKAAEMSLLPVNPAVKNGAAQRPEFNTRLNGSAKIIPLRRPSRSQGGLLIIVRSFGGE